MAYRDDVDALAARHAALSVQLAEKQRDLAEAARLLADARGQARSRPAQNIAVIGAGALWAAAAAVVLVTMGVAFAHHDREVAVAQALPTIADHAIQLPSYPTRTTNDSAIHMSRNPPGTSSYAQELAPYH